ncbi:NAD(P)-dependent oxidoreductase [Fredinandcohnia salidurans]|uniref:NAD(P)-dependent oxidoreductase n=1 Tax=Fredinandcohnia salidurans TaxID=2595041 RepID=A0ABW4MLU8_9BACI|nr:NAD(P)-dependent oxidoreductase [Fredinandcohnia onubensis]
MREIEIKSSIVIGFIGIGVMGSAMAKNLLLSGYKLNIYTRSKEKASELIKLGAIWRESVREVTLDSDVIITMVGLPSDVENLYLKKDGIIEAAKRDTLVIDMTTSKPSLAKMIFQKALLKGILALDAPVSGGEDGAKNGSLTIMVGGSEVDFHKALPILETMGKNIYYEGTAGAGQYTKICNQVAMANNMVGLCESIILSKKAGLDPKGILRTLTKGTSNSWVMENLAHKMIEGDFKPGFYVKHLIKDLTIAYETFKEMNVDAPGLKLSLSLFKQLADMGEENNGTRALIKVYETE